MGQTVTALPVGIFPVLTQWNVILGAYEDERSGSIAFQDPHSGRHDVSAVVILSGPANPEQAPGMRAQSLTPQGYELRLFLQEGKPWVEVTVRPAK